MRVAMIEPLATVVVLLAGLYFACLGAVALAVPAVARRFLLGFARSRERHYLELAVRLVVGGAFLLRAPALQFLPLLGLASLLLGGLVLFALSSSCCVTGSAP